MPAKENLYFIALVPPEPLRSQIWDLKEQMRDEYGSKASLNSPAHITLHMPFKLKENREKAVTEALQELASGYNTFPVVLKGFGAFPPRVIYLDVLANDMLSRLQADVHQLMKRGFSIFNADYKQQPFHPHVTLAFRDLKKSAFQEAWSSLKEKEYRSGWQAQEVTLLRHEGQQWQPLATALFSDAAELDEETDDTFSEE